MPDEVKGENPQVALLRDESLASTLEAEIQRTILSGAFRSGDRLKESVLAKKFKVSRGPVREACRSLAAKGLVEMKPNRGFFIKQMSPEEAADIYDVRAALFGCAARLYSGKISDADRLRVRDLVDAMDQAASTGDIDQYYPANLEFHRMIVEGSGNETLARSYRGLVESLHLFRARGLVQAHNMEHSNVEHKAIFDALLEGDGDKAFAAAFQHVDTAKARMLSAAEQVS